MNKKEELKTIIDSLNNLMGKIDSVDEPKPSTDFTTGNNAFKHLQKPKYPEGILSFKTCYDQIVSFKNQVGNYQNWCNGHLGKERENIVPSTIHSVKNSKGEVFTIGDLTQYGNITGFTLGAEDVYASFEGGYTVSSPVDWLVKKEPQPSWKDQIVAFRSQNLIYRYSSPLVILGRNDWVQNHLNQKNEIFTVKNKAGVEFSVGDDTNYGKIKSFIPAHPSETKGHLQVISDGGAISFNYPLEEYTKAEPKKVSDHIRRFAEMEPELEPLTEKPKLLFKTEDGIPVYEGQEYLKIWEDGSGFEPKYANCHPSHYRNYPAIRFAKLENAKKYIETKKQKPLFITEDGFEYYSCTLENKLFGVKHDFGIIFPCAGGVGDVYKYFKLKSNAEKYVAENKKSISYKELEDYVVLTTPFLKLPEQVSLRNILNHFKPQ